MNHIKTLVITNSTAETSARAFRFKLAAKNFSRAISLLFLFIAMPTYAAQDVGGLAISYSPAFTQDKATANSWLSKIPESIRPLVSSLDVYVAPPSNGLGEVRVMKLRYVPDLDGNIDGSASESGRRISTLDGVSNFKQQITPLIVSGISARQVSISADRWGGKLGGEFLIIYDRRTNTLWQVQLIFAKKKSLIPFVSVDVDSERQYAKSILSTITVLP